MEIKRVVTLAFSPTHGTEKLVSAAAKAIEAPDRLDLNRTSFDSRWNGAELHKGDFAVIGVPIYYGRVPRIMVEFFRYIKAHDVPAVLLLSYGNCQIGDAPLELYDESLEHGFIPIACGTFVSRHSFTDKLGTGRPNDDDLQQAANFGAKSAKLVRNCKDLKSLKLKVPGNFPYKPAMDMPIAPVTDMSKCTGCMLCQKQCPVQAINPLDPSDIDGWRCLDCARCIQNCPNGAKALTLPALQEKITIMEYMFANPNTNEVYFAK